MHMSIERTACYKMGFSLQVSICDQTICFSDCAPGHWCVEIQSCLHNKSGEWVDCRRFTYIYITLSVMQFILYMVSFTLVNTMGPFIICIRRGYCSPCEAVEAWDCNCHAAWIAVGLGWLPMLQMVIARPASCLRLAMWHWSKLNSEDMSLAVIGLICFG